ncbi:MAG: thioredoxin family protein [Vicinamibacterales bacterium]
MRLLLGILVSIALPAGQAALRAASPRPPVEHRQERADAPERAPERLFEAGEPFERFAARAAVHAGLWTRVRGARPDLVARLRRAAGGLRVLVVAEHWCVDSANTVPWLARAAAEAGIPLRIIDRERGRGVLDAHRTADGRTATPLVLLVREDGEAAAWVERPAALQRAFRDLFATGRGANVFTDRQAWYDRDAGGSALAEIVALAERHVGMGAEGADARR